MSKNHNFLIIKYDQANNMSLNVYNIRAENNFRKVIIIKNQFPALININTINFEN